MSKLALGTVQFGLDYGITNQSGQVTIKEVKGILDFAKENGIDVLDTASGYGNSEKVLGEVGVDNYQIITKGSSLKLCLVASGKAHIYPRFGPTSEWDIAAGEAIVNFAGGNIVNLDGKPLTYNLKESFLNPEFLCTSSDNLKEKLLSLLD